MNIFNTISRLLLSNVASVVLFMAFFAAGTRSGLGSHEPKLPNCLKEM